MNNHQPSLPEHPFTQYVRILGKGKSGTRSLTIQEAEEAFEMVLRGEVDPIQLGAFLMLLRVKEETGAELAGFVKACRQVMLPAPSGLEVDLDWSSYAGKKHQHPWYILSILLLVQAGYRVFIHGEAGHTAGRLYTEQAFLQLQLPVAENWIEAAGQLDSHGLSYLPLHQMCSPLSQLIQLKPLLGLRSPVHTLTRMFNPLEASASIQSVFHPAYAALHQEADRILEQPRALVFKGDSGETEIKPQADTRLSFLKNGNSIERLLPRSLKKRITRVDIPAVEPLEAMWRTGIEDVYGLEAVLATTAAALSLLDDSRSLEESIIMSRELWRNRDRARLPRCH